MKIGICCYPSYGGSGVVATELGINLSKLGHEVHFITYDKPFRLKEYHDNIFYHVVETPSYPVFQHAPYIMALANKIYEIAKREKLEILHAHYAVPHALAIHLAKEMLGGNIKTVTTIHGTDVTIMSEEAALKSITEFALNKSDAITAVSEDLKTHASKVLNLDKKIKRIYNFIDTTEYCRGNYEPVKCCNLCEGEKVVIHISNFRAVKRIPDVMNIFNKIQEEVPSRLLLVGDGPDQRIAYEMAEKLGIIDKVKFLGRQNDVTRLLAHSNLFLLPSEKESFGLAALEAMSCGVPVVATRAGGIPEVVCDGIDGYLSNVGDVEKMANDAIRILSDDKLQMELSKNARNTAAVKFDSNVILKEYASLYEEILL
jgi:N-acetyl-alpha-D-glucosaminyl L-malate synthase BshA